MENANKIDNGMTFKERFKELVGNSTQEEVANKINTSRQNVGNWLNGKSRPDIYALTEISKAFTVSTDYLLGLTDIKSADTTIQDICKYTGLADETIKHFLKLKNSSEFYLLEVVDFLIQQHKNAYKNGVVQRNLLELMWQYIFAKIEIPTISAADFPIDLNSYEDFINGEASDIFIYKIKEMGIARMCTTDTLKNIILMEIEDVLKSSVNHNILEANIEK